MEEQIRLQKYFSDCGVLSRRAAEAEISAGHVSVNGTVAALGTKICPGKDHVLWNGREILPRPEEFQHTYIMLNKPLGYVTTLSDEKGRPAAVDLLSDVGCRVYPVGRLDMYSEGLLLFTDDGDLTNQLTHPSHSIPKLYQVKVKGDLSKEDMKRLTAPMELDGYRLRPIEARLHRHGVVDRDGSLYSVLRITLYEGRNRQIRRMCEQAGIVVMRLRRIAEGNVELGELAPGKWRHLAAEEVAYLKHACANSEETED